MTRLSVDLSYRAQAALGAIQLMTERSDEETVNAALLVYAQLVEVGTHTTPYHVELQVDVQPLHVIACRTEELLPGRSR